MNKNLGILLIFVIFVSCKITEKEKTGNSVKIKFQEIKKTEYELSKPVDDIRSVLVLFGGYPEKADVIKREFNILEIAKENRIAVVFMNYNQKLWLEENEKQKLAEQVQNIFLENKLPTNNVYIGGFSSGGNVAILVSDFMAQQNLDISPKGVFIVDSPVDLAALYKSSEKNIKRNFSEPSVQESSWLLETLQMQFGNPNSNILKYEEYSIYTAKTNNIDNLKYLMNTKIRFYTEPDTLWWKENRMADYDQMNAYYIKRLSERLKRAHFSHVEYIPTINKGFRANGERHPHSWTIVDKKKLIDWMLNE